MAKSSSFNPSTPISPHTMRLLVPVLKPARLSEAERSQLLESLLRGFREFKKQSSIRRRKRIGNDA